MVLTGRDDSAAKSVADEVGGDTRGIALDLSEPEQVADALADVGAVDHLVFVAIARDTNTLDNYNIASARYLVTMKLLGYTAVVSAMRDRPRRTARLCCSVDAPRTVLIQADDRRYRQRRHHRSHARSGRPACTAPGERYSSRHRRE